jgi:hypothetical protein
MKALLATAVLLALSAGALAKPNPIERSRLALINADINIGSVADESSGSAGAMSERDYFEAPQPPFSAGALPCRMEPVLFHKTYVTQSCL